MAYDLFKNKSKERLELLKNRITFSYFRHPLKQRGKIVGRALSLLPRQAQLCMATFEMLDLRNICIFVERVNEQLCEQSGDMEVMGIPTFELF